MSSSAWLSHEEQLQAWRLCSIQRNYGRPASGLTHSMWAEAPRRFDWCRQDDTRSVSTDIEDTPQTTYGSVGFLSYVERGTA
jgi:hypothetical protein